MDFNNCQSHYDSVMEDINEQHLYNNKKLESFKIVHEKFKYEYSIQRMKFDDLQKDYGTL